MSTRRCGYLMVSMLAGGLLVLALLGLLGAGKGDASASAGTVRYVAPGGDCGGAAPCYSTIQAAVDASSEGDEIRVAAGTYTDLHARPRADVAATTGVVTQVVYISNSVTLRGGYLIGDGFAGPPDGRAHRTIIDAGGQGRGLYITGEISPTIEEMEITGGAAKGGAWPGWADVGGGVYIITATAALHRNSIHDNAGSDCGGGIYVTHSRSTLAGNELSDNRAIQGAGLCVVDADVLVDGNAVHGNQAWHGAGVYVDNAGSAGYAAALRNNLVLSNTTTGGCGGGLYLRNGADTLINNVIAGNQAVLAGSGLCIVGASPRLLHSTLAGNTGGDGSGVYVTDGSALPGSAVWMTDTILAGHAVAISITAGSAITLEATLWGGGDWGNGIDWTGAGVVFTGTHNTWGDPAFVEPEAGDYHIGAASAAIDAGVNSGVTRDMDGNPRPVGGGYDGGADEYVAGVAYLPLVLR